MHFRNIGISQSGKLFSDKMNPFIVSIGSLNADIQVRVDRLPGLQETLIGRDFMMLGGGKAANVAFLARRLGVESRLVARVGSDSLADLALKAMKKVGVDLRHVKTVPGQCTAVTLIFMRPDGGKATVLSQNANDAWGHEDEKEITTALNQAPVGSVLVIDLDIPAFLVRYALQEARRRNLAVILDASPINRFTEDMFRYCDFVTLTLGDAARLLGRSQIYPEEGIEAAAELATRGSATICLKMGAAGCAVVGEEVYQTLSSPIPTRPMVVTGGGEAFAGALAVALLQKRKLQEALSFAVTVSTLAVTNYGAQTAYPDMDEVEKHLAQGVSG